MKKISSVLVLLFLLLPSGCDWNDVSAVVGYLSYGGSPVSLVSIYDYDSGGGDEDWWHENDQHFDWLWWPFN